jgi:hypothetical protein
MGKDARYLMPVPVLPCSSGLCEFVNRVLRKPLSSLTTTLTPTHNHETLKPWSHFFCILPTSQYRDTPSLLEMFHQSDDRADKSRRHHKDFLR